MHVTGKCHCGHISYEADLDPGLVAICHCTDCQMLSGSPYRVSVRVPKAHFRLLSGIPKIYIKTAESGSKRAHSFCPNCGTPVYSSDVSNPQSFSLRIGCLDKRDLLTPQKQIWHKSSLPWSGELASIPMFSKQ